MITEDVPAIRPRRSCLYMPGTNERAHEKARTLPADVLIFDLEDSVAPEAKDDARRKVVETVDADLYRRREIMIRVNAVGTPWAEADLLAAARSKAGGIVLPKVTCPEDVRRAGEAIAAEGGAARLWVMMETARAVSAAEEIAGAHEKLAGFTMGLEDLAKELGAEGGGDRLPMLYSLERCVLAARAHGLAIIDAVFPAFADDEGLAASCAQGRRLGFDGKQLIHPRQIETANKLFGPSGDALREARRIVDAFAEAKAQGAHVAVLDGRMVEALHVEEARRVIALVEVIAALERETAS